LAPISRSGRGLIASSIALAIILTSTVAIAQNLDAGKSPARLFADGCGTCHRSPRGLAKGRFSMTLAWYLEDHFATSAASAKSLATYLEEVDAAGTRPAAKRPRSAPRPTKPVTSP
jgi:mono/diheme cytochrome c family protein